MERLNGAVNGFGRFSERSSMIQAESESPLVNQGLKTSYMRTTSYLLLVSARLLLLPKKNHTLV